MFLTGTLLNVAIVLIGATVGLLLGARMPARMQESLTTGLGLYTLVLGVSMATRIFTDPRADAGDNLAVLTALLSGVAIGELLGLHDRLEQLGGWFQRRLSRDDRRSRISEGFVTASLVFCVGPLTILGSLDNGLRGDITLLAVKSLLDGVGSIAFAACPGPRSSPSRRRSEALRGRRRTRSLPIALGLDRANRADAVDVTLNVMAAERVTRAERRLEVDPRPRLEGSERRPCQSLRDRIERQLPVPHADHRQADAVDRDRVSERRVRRGLARSEHEPDARFAAVERDDLADLADQPGEHTYRLVAVDERLDRLADGHLELCPFSGRGRVQLDEQLRDRRAATRR